MSNRIDLLGKKFGAWTVTSFGGLNENKQTTWHCVCDCGTQKRVVAQTLREGLTTSCGCLKAEKIASARTKHGHSRSSGRVRATRTYEIWCAMKARCDNPNHKSFADYGGRGVKVCKRWEESFENFIEDMGFAPPERSIDRINNDRNYEKANCRWATSAQQASNRRPRRWKKRPK